MNKNKFHGAHVGSASILLVFTVLSIISFATLTLVNSKADYNLSNKLANRQEAYYTACHEAYAFIAAINSGYDYQSEDGIIMKSIPINDNQTLDITLSENTDIEATEDSYQYVVTQWQIVNHSDFDYDYTLPVKQK